MEVWVGMYKNENFLAPFWLKHINPYRKCLLADGNSANHSAYARHRVAGSEPNFLCCADVVDTQLRVDNNNNNLNLSTELILSTIRRTNTTVISHNGQSIKAVPYKPDQERHRAQINCC